MVMLVACALSFQPSFACGCGDQMNGGISGWIILTLIGLSFLIPLIYAISNFKLYRLSAFVLIFNYILSFGIVGGIYILLSSFSNYIRLPIIHKAILIEMIALVSCVVVILLWIFPAIYTYRKGRWVKGLSYPDSK